MFLYSKWIDLSISTRHAIASEFGIIKRGSTEVVANVIKSDGYLVREVEAALNIDALQRYLKTDCIDLPQLWEWLVDKIEGRSVSIPTLVVEAPVAPQMPIKYELAVVAKPKGRQKGSKNKPKSNETKKSK